MKDEYAVTIWSPNSKHNSRCACCKPNNWMSAARITSEHAGQWCAEVFDGGSVTRYAAGNTPSEAVAKAIAAVIEFRSSWVSA